MNRKNIKIIGIFVAAGLLFGCGNANYDKEETDSVIMDTNVLNTETEDVSQEVIEFPAFTAVDLQGNSVTEAIFAEKDLTVINIWGTFCAPCIKEMPELGEWAKNMPDNVQMIGLIIDINGEEDTKRHDLAVTITEKAEADFLQIIANQDFTPILNEVFGVPTTLFVDKNGDIVGEPIIGADVDGYKKFVEDYFNEEE